MSRALTLLCACLVTAGLTDLAAQRDVRRAVGTGAISGVVSTTADVPQPVRRVTVTLSSAQLPADRRVVTDDQGRFTFTALPPGRYQLVADKPAYVTTHYGSHAFGRGPGTPIALADGQQVYVTIRLPRGAVLAGTVRNEAGQPLASSGIQLQRPVVLNGETRWFPVPLGRQVTTDEQGRYRAWGLAPGDYIVRASGPAGYLGEVRQVTPVGVESALREIELRSRGQATSAAAPVLPQVAYVQTFAASAPDRASAQRFTLREGQEYLGADVTVTLGRSGRVSGLAVGPSGLPLSNVSVAIVNTRDRTTWASPGIFRPGADGRFALPSLGPGEYAFVGRGAEGPTSSPDGMTLFTSTGFTMLGDDVEGLRVEFVKGGTVQGVVEVAGGGAVPPAARVVVSQVDAIAGTPGATMTVAVPPDGRFVIEGVPPGRLRVGVTGLGALAVRSAMVGDSDALDTPFPLASAQTADVRVVLTPQPAVVTGVLQDQLGRPAPEYAVVVFSTDRAQWQTGSRRASGLVRLDSNGRYRVVGLPPGSYYLAAVTDADPQQLGDPSFLEQLAAAALTITLTEGQVTTQDLRLAGG